MLAGDDVIDDIKISEKIEPPKISPKSPRVNIDKINVEVIHNVTNDNSIIVDFDQSQCKFTIYDRNKTLLGNFSSAQLIKYITSKVSRLFLNRVDVGTSYGIIETYICKVIEIDDCIKIELLNHMKSPFMGNIDMIMKLYNGIHKFEVHQLKQELDEMFKIDQCGVRIQKKIYGIVKQMVYLLLNHALKLIVTITDITKDDPNKKELKETLMKYSVAIVHKISGFMKDEIENKINDYKLLQDDLVRMGKIKLEMYKKVIALEKAIIDQNNQIKTILEKLDNPRMQGLSGGGENKNVSAFDITNSSTTWQKTSSSSSNVMSDISESNTGTGSENCFTESGNEISHINYLSSSSHLSQTKSNISDIHNLKSLV